MTDKEKLKQLLNDFGIQFLENESQISLEADTEKVGGYSGFTCEFNFEIPTDRFLTVNMWE